MSARYAQERTRHQAQAKFCQSIASRQHICPHCQGWECQANYQRCLGCCHNCAAFRPKKTPSVEELLAELEGKTGRDRAAYYVSSVVLANPAGEVLAVAEGRCWGVIDTVPHGAGGFGYDPLFVIPEYHASFGELSARVKHALSHRGRAIALLRPALRKLLVK